MPKRVIVARITLVIAIITSSLAIATPASAISATKICTAAISAVTVAGTTAIASLTASTLAGLQVMVEFLLGGDKVAAMQQALSTQTMNETMVQSARMQAESYAAAKAAARMADAIMAFGPTGQGYNNCAHLAQGTAMQKAQDAVPKLARSLISKTDVAPCSTVSAPESEAARLKAHLKLYCTQAAHDSKLCSKVSPEQGADIDLGSLIQPHEECTDAMLKRAEAGDSEALKACAPIFVIQNTIGPSLGVVSEKAGPDMNLVFDTRTRAEAMRSIASTILADLSARNTRTSDNGGKSANELIEERVGMFFGGDQQKEWMKAMISQHPRGLILETTKMEGLNSWLRFLQYEQGMRMEMALSALTLDANKSARDRVATEFTLANARTATDSTASQASTKSK